ncbi:MAG: serine hydrolase [Xanthomonadales bacterium]|jgi:CubicO group peptidase (beta-lactamase class C family)|nr:serine hydrolase [Xanthomonadales bacterium]
MKHLLFLLLLVAPSLSAQAFDGLSEALERGDFGNIKAVVVSRHGEIIYEDYFRGSSADDLHQVQSVTKSVGSALVGIAHRKGAIQLDQDLGHYFSGLYDMSQGAFQDKAGITVEQVLSHRLGIEWDEESTDYRNPMNSTNQMLNSDDWYEFVLTRPMATQAGENFKYSSGASNLMSRMIRVATGEGPEEFAARELFGPLGIGSVHWELYSEQGQGTGVTDWLNPDGDAPLGFGLWLRARDMAKIGQLYLDGGVYNGRRILDQSWVDASWTRHSHKGNSDYSSSLDWGYGYQWWMIKLVDLSNRPWHVFFASGWGSQVIFVLPELDLVVVTTADNYDHNGADVDALLLGYILPALSPHLDSRFNGSWFNPVTSGQGFSMEVLDEREDVLSYWYTYTDTGEKHWFILQGKLVNGIGEVVIYEAEGGVFLQADPVTLSTWGSGRFVPVDCDHMNLEVESSEVNTIIPLTRLSGRCYVPPGS